MGSTADLRKHKGNNEYGKHFCWDCLMLLFSYELGTRFNFETVVMFIYSGLAFAVVYAAGQLYTLCIFRVVVEYGVLD